MFPNMKPATEMFQTQTNSSRPRLALVRRKVPQRLWANFQKAGQWVDLTVFETAPELSETENPVETHGYRLLRVQASSVSNIYRLLDELQPQVLLCFGWGDLCSLASLTWAKANGRRTIVSSDSNRDDLPRAQHKEFVKARILNTFDLAWAAGGNSAAYLETLGFSHDRIYTGGLDTVDIDYFENGALAARTQGEILRAAMALPQRFFLCVARLSPEKNLHRLLQAYARYRAQIGVKAWDLVLVGDGPLRAALEAQAAELSVYNHVHFRGFAGYSDLPPYYGLADAFVLASVKDTWAVVVNEAAAAHLPLLISTRAGSCEELVRDGENGFCFNPWDMDDLAAKMAWLAGDMFDLAAMGLRSREIVQGHGPEAYGTALGKMTERALSLSPRPFGPIARLACKTQIALLK